MGDDPHVGFDDLHVDAVLLLSDDDRPPQPDVLALLLGAVRGDRIMRVACATPAGCAGLWYQTEEETTVVFFYTRFLAWCRSTGVEPVMSSGSAVCHGEPTLARTAGFNSHFFFSLSVLHVGFSSSTKCRDVF